MRRPRSLREHKRHPQFLDISLVLVVTEGAETEPRYFDELRSVWRLTGVKVKPSPDSAPIRVVEESIRLRNEAIKAAARGSYKSPFDQVWVVFDKDQHSTVNDAMQLAKQEGILVAYSNPCFELWILLHFVRSLKPLATCDEVIRELLVHIPGYSKALNPTELMPRVDKAILHSQEVLEQVAKPGMGSYPSTSVHDLVLTLQAFRRDT